MRTAALSKGLLTTGAAALALAFAWWWATYGEVVGAGYLRWREAGRCLVHDSDLCALARTLCLGVHPRALIAYPPSAFWLCLGVLSVSALVRSASPSTGLSA